MANRYFSYDDLKDRSGYFKSDMIEKIQKSKELLEEAHELLLSVLAQNVKESRFEDYYIDGLYEAVSKLRFVRSKI